MILVCPACKNQLTLDDASVPEGIFKVRCTGCGKIITSQRHPEPMAPSLSPGVMDRKIGADQTLSPAIQALIRKEISSAKKEMLDAIRSLFRGTGIAQEKTDDPMGTRKALICSGDLVTSQALTQAARAMGYETETAVTAADSMKTIDGMFSLVLIDPSFGDDSEASKKLIGRLNSKRSVDRREVFVVLISTTQKTGDGNAAFMSGVNLIVHKGELNMIEASIRQSQKDFEKMYATFYQLTEKA